MKRKTYRVQDSYPVSQFSTQTEVSVLYNNNTRYLNKLTINYFLIIYFYQLTINYIHIF